MCLIDNSDGCEFLSQSRHRARVQHKCCECRRTIEPGESYERFFGKAEGDTFGGSVCRHCIAVREWLVKVCGGYLFEGVMEDLEEHIGEGFNPRWLNIAVSGMRKKWRDKDGEMRRPMSLPKQLPLGDAPQYV